MMKHVFVSTSTEDHEEKNLQHTQYSNVQSTVNDKEMNGIKNCKGRIDGGNFYFSFHETRVLPSRIKKCRLT